MYAEAWGNKAGKKGRIENSEMHKLHHSNNLTVAVFFLRQLLKRAKK